MFANHVSDSHLEYFEKNLSTLSRQATNNTTGKWTKTVRGQCAEEGVWMAHGWPRSA